MNEFWFKPHRYGIGAKPTTWEGWVVVAAFLAAEIGLAVWLRNESPAKLLASSSLLAAVLVFVAWRKTEGEWRWRWDGK